MQPFLAVPPIPSWFKPEMEPPPVRRLAREALNPRELDQYRYWCDSDESADTSIFDPAVRLFIEEERTYHDRYATWHLERERQRILQWPAYFLRTQSPELLAIPLVAQIVAAWVAGGRPTTGQVDKIVQEASYIAQRILAHAGIGK